VESALTILGSVIKSGKKLSSFVDNIRVYDDNLQYKMVKVQVDLLGNTVMIY
jgi:hypothetical protein